MARIQIYIARHLCTAPRPIKEADALAAAGHDVSVHGVAYHPLYATRDAELVRGRAWRWDPVADFTTRSRASRLRWLAARARHRWAKIWFDLTGRARPDVWSVASGELAAHATHSRADLTIVHSEAGLWFGHRLCVAGSRVGVDFEDWFSRDLTPAQRRGRPIYALADLERELLRRCRYQLATSHAMAAALGETYGVPPPAVIYNTFSSAPLPPQPQLRNRVTLHWFSLVLGPERGLETLAAALPHLTGDWQLTLRGEAQPGYVKRWLALVPPALHERVTFCPTVSASELPGELATNDIGLALDVSSIPSRNLTITNKLFHYLHAGLAVAATATAGHCEILGLAAAAGLLFPPDDAFALAAALNQWINDPSKLLNARRAARAAFVEHFAHERQQHRYAELAAAALAAPA